VAKEVQRFLDYSPEDTDIDIIRRYYQEAVMYHLGTVDAEDRIVYKVSWWSCPAGG